MYIIDNPRAAGRPAGPAGRRTASRSQLPRAVPRRVKAPETRFLKQRVLCRWIVVDSRCPVPGSGPHSVGELSCSEVPAKALLRRTRRSGSAASISWPITHPRGVLGPLGRRFLAHGFSSWPRVTLRAFSAFFDVDSGRRNRRYIDIVCRMGLLSSGTPRVSRILVWWISPTHDPRDVSARPRSLVRGARWPKNSPAGPHRVSQRVHRVGHLPRCDGTYRELT